MNRSFQQKADPLCPLAAAQQTMAVCRRLAPAALIGFYRVEGYGTRSLRLSPLSSGAI